MKRGKLLVFEGISGTGKETQAKLLRDYLARHHIASVIVFHPTAEIKPILRAQKTLPDQLRVLAADRKSRVDTVIRPALARGEWVISLRNFISAYVYQGDGRCVEAVDIPPDFLFYFDIDPSVSMKRIIARGEVRGKYETLRLLKDKRKQYTSILQKYAHTDIDASRSIDAIHREVVKYIHI